MAGARDLLVHASIVYVRIPEFARRPVAEQARLRAQLDAALAVLLIEIEPDARAVLDAADGAVLLVLDDPGAALRVAERMLRTASAGLVLAIGINHGAVRFTNDGGTPAFWGDGIATAASIAGFTSPSRLQGSRAFRDALHERDPGESAGLREAGVFTDAGLRTHELYSQDRSRGVRRRRVVAVLGGLAGLVLLAAAVAYRSLTPDRPRPLSGVTAKIEHQALRSAAAAWYLLESARR